MSYLQVVPQLLQLCIKICVSNTWGFLNRLFEGPEHHGDSIVTVMKTEQLCYFHENGEASEELESKVPALFLACLCSLMLNVLCGLQCYGQQPAGLPKEVQVNQSGEVILLQGL